MKLHTAGRIEPNCACHGRARRRLDPRCSGITMHRHLVEVFGEVGGRVGDVRGSVGPGVALGVRALSADMAM